MKLERIQIPSSTYGPNSGLRIRSERHKTFTEEAVTLDPDQEREKQKHHNQKATQEGEDTPEIEETAEAEHHSLDITA